MNIEYLRASTAGTYQDCPWKYFLIYVVGFPSLPNKKAELGTICHHVLELLAKAKKNGYTEYNINKRTDPEYLLKICWKRYTDKNPQFNYDENDYKFCQDQVKAVIESRFDPLALKILKTEHQFEIEANIEGFEYQHKDYKTGEDRSGNMLIRGTIDLITEIAPDTIEIIDYKTGIRNDWVTGVPKD